MNHRTLPSLAAFTLMCALHAQPINGPMPGYSDMLESRIWLQCQEPGKVFIMYWDTAAPARRYTTATAQALRENAFALELVADSVKPGRTYAYHVVMNDKPVIFPEQLTFKTQGLWKFRTDPPDFSMATGSCAYINEPDYDRPGKPYGGDEAIFDRIAEAKPDLMLWLGDNVYLREPDWGSWTGFLHRYTHTRSSPALQRLLRSTHHYAIWDDHDFGPNDADRSFVNAEMAHKAFDLFWANPRPMPDLGIFTQFSQADVDFFLLDDRSFRTAADLVTDSSTMLGAAQIDRLIEALKYSDGSFRIVALGSQFLNSEGIYETYATFPRERQRILDRINAEGIKNVVFLTGDRHHTVLSQLTLPNGEVVHDLTVSPLTSGVHEPKEQNKNLVPGTLVAERNFAVLRFSGPKKQRVLTISVRGTDGVERWNRAIPAR